MKKRYFALAGSLLAFGFYFLHKRRRFQPPGAIVVADLDVHEFMGKWHEIARLDFSHERNLIFCTAEYSLLENGQIKIVNSGWNKFKEKQETSIGKALFRTKTHNGALKATFWGFFYAGYNIISIEPDYQYALVAGSNLRYLWILGRKKTLPIKIKNKFLALASSLGYKTEDLLWTSRKKSVHKG